MTIFWWIVRFVSVQWISLFMAVCLFHFSGFFLCRSSGDEKRSAQVLEIVRVCARARACFSNNILELDVVKMGDVDKRHAPPRAHRFGMETRVQSNFGRLVSKVYAQLSLFGDNKFPLIGRWNQCSYRVYGTLFPACCPSSIFQDLSASNNFCYSPETNAQRIVCRQLYCIVQSNIPYSAIH